MAGYVHQKAAKNTAYLAQKRLKKLKRPQPHVGLGGDSL